MGRDYRANIYVFVKLIYEEWIIFLRVYFRCLKKTSKNVKKSSFFKSLKVNVLKIFEKIIEKILQKMFRKIWRVKKSAYICIPFEKKRLFIEILREITR